MRKVKLFEEWVNSLSDGIVTCKNCGWKWDIVTGGNDPWTCHKCGKDNFPVLEKKKTEDSPDWHDSDAPDAEGRFKDLGIKDLAAWLIKTRKKDLKKISGSLTQQIVFNRGKDPEYAKKMEKTREEVYRQLGRKDLLDEKESPYDKDTLLKYKKEYEQGKDIPFGVKTSLIAQGMIPREGGKNKGKKVKSPEYVNEKRSHVYLYEQWIAEGGWATAKTQGTIIRPKIISDAVGKIHIVGNELNQHLQEIGLPLLDFSKPVGSGTWYEEDIESQPDKVYGDIDFIVSYPKLDLTGKSERDDELATVKLYNKEILDFLQVKKYAFIDLEETLAVSTDTSVKFIVQVKTEEGDGWVQVDLVVTHVGYKEWSIFRMTPIRNVKGFVLGNLYSSFGEVLELAIQPRGVRAKFIGDEMVSMKKRKGTDEVLISKDVNTFMRDIAHFFWEQSKTDKPYEEAPSLANWKGMDPNNPRFEDLVEGIKGVAETLEKLGEFGTVIKYKDAKSLLTAVKERYAEKMETAATSSKFSKADSPAAKAAVQKVRDFVDEYVKKANELL